MIRICHLPFSFLLCLVAGIVQPVYASPSDKSDPAAVKRPKIGLVLSGGGARGSAHVGILKVLEQNHIPVDYIAGTSMGSVIGALYASGMSPDEITQALNEIDWEDVFEDSGSRKDKTFRDKDDERLYLIKQQIGVKDGNMQLPTAFIQGQRFEQVIRKLTIQASEIRDFDKLPIPFRAIATDIATGEAVVLGRGNLSVAIRASMAVPGAFSAVEIDGKLLVDGGIANNLPVSVVRNMGADIIIAVDISTPLLEHDELNNALAIVGQLTGLLTRRNTERQLARLTDQDILIIPELGSLTSGDFNRYNEAIAAGVKAATKQLSVLKPLALSASAYSQVMSKHNTDYYQPPVIDFIRINDKTILDNKLFLARLDIKPGDVLNTDVIEQGTNEIYALGNYAHVGYTIIEAEGQTGLEINTTEKSWGTSGIEFGLDISTDMNGKSVFNFATAYTMKPMNSLNAEWRSVVQLGQNPILATEWYQPLDAEEKYFINPILEFERTTVNNFLGSDIASEHQIEQTQLLLWVGRNFGNLARLRAGYSRSTGSVKLLTGDPTDIRLKGSDFDGGSIITEFLYDSLNSVSFPTSGSTVKLSYTTSRESLGADQNVDLAGIAMLGAYPVGEGSILLKATFNTALNNDAAIQQAFQIGGFLNLSGLQRNQLAGLDTGLLMTAYMHRLSKSRFFNAFAGASLELGNAWNDTSEINYKNTLTAGSVFLGADTPIGPVYLALGVAEGGERSLYLLIGTPLF